MLIAPFKNAYEIFMRAREENEPVIFPTDTIYGIGAPVSDIKANQKIYEIKGREKNKPFPVLVSSYEQAEELAYISADQKKILSRLWAGPYTFILKSKESVNGLFTLNGNIALRMPDNKNLLSLIDKTGALSATSANLSGVVYNPSTEYIISTFQALVKFIVISHQISAVSSTIIDLTNATPKLVRGEINLHEIIDTARK